MGSIGSRWAIHPDVAKQHSLSVIVCAHKEGDEVRKTVASILDHGDEVGRLQVIVGDDGAPDGCCDGMPSGVEVLRMGRHAGRGVTANEAAKHATGDVLLYPDAHMRVPAGALGNVLATAHEYQAVTCAGVQGEEKDHGCQGWGAAFRFHRRGRLGVRFCQPEGGMTPGEAVQVEQPFGGFYAFPRPIFDRLGGWTDTAACWGYCEQPIGFMAWCLDVPILAVPDIISHKFRKVNPAGANET
ncbi:MAG: glycosyltransferase family 2 protein, partial [Planctomycetota bacterium]